MLHYSLLDIVSQFKKKSCRISPVAFLKSNSIIFAIHKIFCSAYPRGLFITCHYKHSDRDRHSTVPSCPMSALVCSHCTSFLPILHRPTNNSNDFFTSPIALSFFGVVLFNSPMLNGPFYSYLRLFYLISASMFSDSVFSLLIFPPQTNDCNCVE